MLLRTNALTFVNTVGRRLVLEGGSNGLVKGRRNGNAVGAMDCRGRGGARGGGGRRGSKT